MRLDYPTDICFSCSKCGLCCDNTPKKTRHVLLSKLDAERIATHAKQQISEFAEETSDKAPYIYELRKNPESGKCIFLKNNQCAIYGERPLICRFYPFQLSTTKNGVYTFTVTNECPTVSNSSTEAGKKLGASHFKALLELACVELRNAL